MCHCCTGHMCPRGARETVLFLQHVFAAATGPTSNVNVWKGSQSALKRAPSCIWGTTPGLGPVHLAISRGLLTCVMPSAVGPCCAVLCCVVPVLQIGVIGWITPTTGVTSRDVGGTQFKPIVPSVTACLAQLKQQHPQLDLVVGLSHSGVLAHVSLMSHVRGAC